MLVAARKSAAVAKALHVRCLAGTSLPAGSQPLSNAAGADVAAAAQRYAQAAPRASLTINGSCVEVPEGSSILSACRKLGIYVPTLCTHPRLPTTPGTCRLCLVEEGGQLKPACATPVRNGMSVSTDSPAVKHSVHSVLALLKANHPMTCATCDVNGRCEFQDLIGRYSIGDGLPTLRSASHEWDEEVQGRHDEYHDSSSAAIHFDLEKCIKCGRCVTACGLVQEMNVLGWAGRSRGRHPATMAPNLAASQCIECGQCAVVCPVGAITERSEWREALDLLESRRKVTVCVTAPSVRVAIGEEVGLAPGSITTGQMVSAQRALGFDYVFDVDFAADLTIMEEGTELLARLRHAWGLEGAAGPGEGHAPGPLPLFTSCCPAWVTLVEKTYPALIPHLSSAKSPQGMMGAVVKRYFASKLGRAPEDVAVVSIMPCTAKKHEAERAEVQRDGEGQDVDLVLTTREFGHMLRHKHIALASLPEGQFDDPLGQATGAAVLFGATGGVMEAALRTAYELAAGAPLPGLVVGAVRGLAGVKEASVRLPDSAPGGAGGREVRVAVASGVGSARHLLQRMAAGDAPKYDFVEVMACPGGCIGGGGQPKSSDPDVVLKRMGAVYSLDERAALRKSHENPALQALYRSFLGQPGGPLALELLHTTYTDRSGAAIPLPAAAAAAAETAPQHRQQRD